MQKVNSFEQKVKEDTIPYLDGTTLVEGAIGTAIAYVSNATTGMAKTQSGFMTFYLKDVHANVITARLFDVKDFLLSGLSAIAYKHNPVIVHYVVQSYGGRKSLILDGSPAIELYRGEFDFKPFVGSFDVDSSILASYAQKVLPNEDIPLSDYATASFDGIGEGRVGAYLKVCNMALAALCEFSDIDGLDVSELLKLFLLASKYYYRILKIGTTYESMSDVKTFELLQEVGFTYKDTEFYMPLVEVVQVLAKQTKPKCIYSHLIDKAFSNAIWSLNLALANSTLPLGAKVPYGGVDLLKY